MKLFNAFQIVAAFVAWPFLVVWLANADFRGVGAAFAASCVLYILAFFAMVQCVYCSMKEID